MFGSARIKAALAGLMVFTLLICNTVPGYALNFQDISGHWAKDQITRLASLEIVNGYNGRFNPNGGVTRAEFAAMIVKALGFSDQAQAVKGSPTGYADVPSSHWASGFVIVARELGVISGYPDNTFKPGAMIRRDEITSVLVRALDLAPSGDMKDVAATFADGGEIPAWAVNAVQVAYGYGLVNGYPDGRFYPGRNATRGETAVLIEKVLAQLGSEFTFYGKLVGVNETSRLLTIDIHGQTESFQYMTGTEVRVDGVASKIDDLKTGSMVYIIVDDDGNVNFIQTDEDGNRDQVSVSSAGKFNTAPSVKPEGGVLNQPSQDKAGVLVVTKKGLVKKVSALVKFLGGTVKFTDEKIDYIFAHVPAAGVAALEKSPLVEEVTPDMPVKVNKLSTFSEDTEGTPTDPNPGKSLNVTKEAIKAPAFVKLTKSDGKNQIIAVIDTGVDAGHPDLQKTSGDKRKIIDWRDFTGEGDIDTSSVMAPDGKNLTLVNGTYYLGDIKSRSGLFRYGYIREVDLANADGNGTDLNFNGKSNDIFALLLLDPDKAGVYEAVYVDTNNNKDFSDEKVLRVFADTPGFATFAGETGRDEFNVVLTEIDEDGSRVNLGFDGNDHGTHVAGIAAANGTIKGVAPGAQIMALKVLDTAGYGDLSTITEAMTYAATHGAKIINLSLGFPVSDANGGSLPAKLLNNLTEQYGAVFVVAAGNDGPGLSTVATPGDAAGALSVGAYNTPEMWKTDYGWKVPADNIWFFSSAGPRKDGAVSPSIVAPGSVRSTVPLRNGTRYYLSEGTSMAAPHVSGAIALLMEVAQRNKLHVTPDIIKKAIEAGAQPIPGYSNAEQGYGALNMPMSWAEILSLKETRKITVQTQNPGNEQGEGIYFREGLPGRLTVNFKNESDKSVYLNLDGGSWVSPGQSAVTIPAGATRSVDFEIAVPDRKGLLSTFITGDDETNYGTEVSMLTTVINPYELNAENRYSVNIDDSQSAAQYKRYFFKIPPGADSLKAEVSVPGGNGRSRIFLFNPTGQLVSETEFAGTNPGGVTEKVTAAANYPAPGVWEAVVYTSAGLNAYNLTESSYNLQVSLSGVSQGDLRQENRRVIIGVTPPQLRAGQKNYITVQVRDRFTKRPYRGFVEINGKIYFSRRGKVTIPVETNGESVKVIVMMPPISPLFKAWEYNFNFIPRE